MKPTPQAFRSAARRGLPLVVAAAAALVAWRTFAEHGPSAPAPAASAPAAGAFRPTKDQWNALKIASVQSLPFRSTLSADGSIAFNEDALTPVFSPYSGRVLKLAAKLGDVVRKGAPLMTVEATEFVQGQSDVATAKSNLDIARATEQRQHALLDAGAAALKDWKQAQADLSNAQAAYAAARGRLRILGKSDADIDTLEKGHAAGMQAAVVTAPISGTVTQRQVGLGQYIASATAGGQTPQFTIGDLSTVWLVANVREGDAPSLRVGQPVDVTVLALPGRSFAAKIAWVGASVDPVTHRLPVRAEVQNREGLLKPMMFASFSVATSEAVTRPAVPRNAVVYEGDKTRVFVADGDSIAVREVRVGRREGDMLEVLYGLKAGERIVTAGTLFVDRAASGD
ncbi:MAG TPA: efflux RND transporter periplasmic adaptor subunit [Rhodocyclaceae bacterium]